jgi:hypothetical protein
MLQGNIILFIVLGLVAMTILIAFREKRTYNIAPKKIWTYWDSQDRLPKTVKMCMESWRKYNPEYEITLLTRKNFYNYVNIPVEVSSHPNFNDNPTRFADLVRLYSLAEHGGVWIDSSVLLKAPLENWIFPRYAEFSGFYIDAFTKDIKTGPVIENWFFACNKGSQFIRKWKEEFLKLADYINVEKYVESRKKMGVDFEKIATPIYLAMHVAAQKVIQIDKYPLDTLILKRAEDGPFKYLVDAKWDSEKALKLACANKKYQEPILKMRGDERKVMEKEIEYDLSSDKCGWL